MARKRKRGRGRPKEKTKLVMRRLPPDLTSEALADVLLPFQESIAWECFVPAGNRCVNGPPMLSVRLNFLIILWLECLVCVQRIHQENCKQFEMLHSKGLICCLWLLAIDCLGAALYRVCHGPHRIRGGIMSFI